MFWGPQGKGQRLLGAFVDTESPHMTGVSFPPFPYRHVRPSLVFVVERWAIVSEDAMEYYQNSSQWSEACFGCYFCRKAKEVAPDITCKPLKHVHFGSELEVLGVFDGSNDDNNPLANPTSYTGAILGPSLHREGLDPSKISFPTGQPD